MAVYKTISYAKMVYEVVRNFFAINKAGELSVFYKFCLCCVYPLQIQFDSFDLWRQRQLIVANCNYTIGQLKNVLNYLFDNSNYVTPNWGRITISQALVSYLYATTIDVEAIVFAPTIDVESTTFAPVIAANQILLGVSINVPTDLSAQLTEIISTIDQIKLDGLTYTTQLI